MSVITLDDVKIESSTTKANQDISEVNFFGKWLNAIKFYSRFFGMFFSLDLKLGRAFKVLFFAA